MANVNTKTYVDIHTTGKRQEFGSLREYDKFLKSHHSYVISKKDIERLAEKKDPPKSDYKSVVNQAWKEREKFKMDVKYGRRKLQIDKEGR